MEDKKHVNINKKKAMRVLLATIFVLGTLFLLQRLFMPKYMTDIVEGAMIAEYYEEEKNHDVVFVGDCELYENMDPVYLWEHYGINSYIRGSAQQLIWQSYYLMEETLKYETPKAIVFNVLSMKYNEPQKEAFNRMTLDGMRWSASKINSIRASMMPDEKFLDYAFPILRYHSRWQELSTEDLEYFWTKDKVSHNGYYLRVDVKPAENVPEGKILADYQFGSTAYAYLDKMRDLCRSHGVQLILVKAPSLYPYWYDEWEEQMDQYAQTNDLPYYNFLDLTEEIGLDFTTDTYDAGLHLNLSGADKLSDYFGKILQQEFEIPDRRGESVLQTAWEPKIKAYEQDIERQKKGEEK
ncbi:MAG: SGNH/GDSL hydrolase family protein [Lachnospiraceae bacterium]|nr:SGNH/GDSL hydrolase family protein [Lachnospiraceae bacterium]